MDTERITVKEIARLAGVSIGTVDRVLHDRGGVSPETKERVDEIIAHLGYEPNILARQLSLNKTYAFRVVLPRADQDSGYWSLCLEGIRRAERDLAPYRVRVVVDEFDCYDRPAYRRLLDDIVAEPCDGLLFAPALPEELKIAIERLGMEGVGCGVPYAFFDSEVEGVSPVAAITQDPLRGGYLAGRLMSLLAKSNGPLIALSAHAGNPHIALRIEGFKSFFSEAGRGPREVESAECQELERLEECDRFLSGLFGARPDIAGVLVANSSGHLVGDWLAERGLKRGCAVVSWDMVPANARALREGTIDCVVSQRPAEQAREGLERLFRAVVRGEGGPAPASIPLEVYFKENIPAGASPDGASLGGADAPTGKG
jgi:LacI family transcriptional regulator